MKLAQVGLIANKANAADAKSRAADCSVIQTAAQCQIIIKDE